MEKAVNSEPEYSHKNLLYQYLTTATGTLAVISAGMHFGWPSPSLPQLLSEDSPIPVTSSEGSWLAVMTCIGTPIGDFAGAFLADRIGRKPCLLLTSPLYFLTWIAIAYSPSLLALNAARFVVGMTDGMTFTILPMFIGEIADRRIRGRLGCCIPITFMLGLLLINVLGLYFSIKVTALIASVIPILHFVTFMWMPESPYYYLIKQKDDKAAVSLIKLTGTQNVQNELNVLNATNNFETSSTGRLLNLFTDKSNRKAFIIVLGLRLVQQFSGNYTITFYCLIIFNEAGGAIAGNTATLIYFSVQLIVAVFSSTLVDKAGRKPLLIISLIGSGIALMAEGIYFYLKNQTDLDISMLGFLPLTALILYNIFYNIGLSTIPIFIVGEFFPIDVKAFALCLVDLFDDAVIVVAAKFFQIFNDAFGMHVPFFAFGICCGAGLIFIVFCLLETKGKTLEQIQSEIRGERRKPVVTNDLELSAPNEPNLTKINNSTS